MTYTLEAAGEATVLTITQENSREPDTDQPAGDEVGADEENPILDALKKLAESM
ncbi:MAG: SRPBCC family protein [Acidimicrobiales bacterium]